MNRFEGQDKAGQSSRESTTDNKVIDLDSRRPPSDSPDLQRIVRLAPENDGLCMLYSNNANPEKLYSMNILFWALRRNGEVVGLIPWLNQLSACTELNDPLDGCWEGYYDPRSDQIFYEAPRHKVIELESCVNFFNEHGLVSAKRSGKPDNEEILQEISDNIGTHAMLASAKFSEITLAEIVSWRLYADGKLSAMLIDDTKVTTTPILPGDDCLYPADREQTFRYFFQHHIANQIKSNDPTALAAVAMLIKD